MSAEMKLEEITEGLKICEETARTLQELLNALKVCKSKNPEGVNWEKVEERMFENLRETAQYDHYWYLYAPRNPERVSRVSDIR